MDRRSTIKQLAAFSAFGLSNSIGANEAHAEYICGNAFPYNGGMVRQCSVGFRINRVTALQECDQWCWAACIESAFELYGFRVSQEDIVQKVYGPNVPCLPSVGPNIAKAVEGYWTDERGDEFYAELETHTDVQFGIHDPFALQNASRYLADDIPVIIGSLGHATLLTSMTWLEDNFGQQRLTEIVVRDPWPYRQNKRLLTAQELYGATYLAAVFVDY